MTRYILVRHGQTEWNRVERFHGRADIPLNDTGQEQARCISRRLANNRIVAVYSSPLSRAIQTGKAIAEPHRLEVIPDAGLLDIDYGAWAGKTPEELALADAKRHALWLTQPDRVQIPKGEDLRMVRRRAVAVVDALAEKYPYETVVLVSHKIVCQVILCAILGLSERAIWRIEQETAAFNVFEKRQDGFAIVTLNDTSHLNRSI